MIIGTVYSTFLQTYANQQLEVKLDDIQEFHDLIRNNLDKISKVLDEDTT